MDEKPVMSDLIDRQNAIDVLEILADKMSDEGRTVMAQAISVLRDLSSAEPEERTAKAKEGWGLAMCCACEKRVFPYDNYCSHCGARLGWK